MLILFPLTFVGLQRSFAFNLRLPKFHRKTPTSRWSQVLEDCSADFAQMEAETKSQEAAEDADFDKEMTDAKKEKVHSDKCFSSDRKVYFLVVSGGETSLDL